MRSTGRFPSRYVLSLLLFWGFFLLYALRVNLSVAIVAMVNGTAVLAAGTAAHGAACPAPDGSLYNATADPETAGGEFSWDERTQGLVLGSFFYGYVLTQVPGGRLAERIGAKRLLGAGILVTSLLTLFTPFAARIGPAALMVLRFGEGVSEGVVFPASLALLSHWSPVHERSRLVSLNTVGTSVGTVVTLPLTAQLCASTWGWPSVFYLLGILGCAWSLLWLSLIHEWPEMHPGISSRELQHIQRHRGTSCAAQQPPGAPWGRLLRSRSVWALGVTMFCGNWGFYLLLIDLPNYLHGVLHRPIGSNGYENAAVHIAAAVSMLLCAPIADLLRKRQMLSVTAIRKLFQTIGLLGPAVCLSLVPLVGCDAKVALVCLVSGMALYGFTVGGQSPLALDIAPDFAGTVMGIVNCMGNLSGMLAPLVTGYFIEHDESLVQWRKLFLLASAIYTFGAVSFVLFGSASVEEWGVAPTSKNSLVSFPHPESDSDEDPDDFRAVAAEMHLM
ncbi:sialin-like isoform X3 [Amblyomma americanum]